MNLPTAVAGRSQPTVAIPGLPQQAVSLQTINHQAAGIDLGCADCSPAQVALRDATTGLTALPMWAKIMLGLTAVSITLTIISLIVSRRR